MRDRSIAWRLARARTALAALLFAVASAGQAADGPGRVALVIGNASYPGGNRLENPVNDANAVASALTELGFAVEVKHDLFAAEMRSVVERFYERAARAEGSFLYYAGHGKQVRGVNVLLPIDVALTRRGEAVAEHEILDRSVRLDEIIERAGDKAAAWNVVVIDACRDKLALSRSAGARPGFAAVAAPRGTIVAFSTAPGARARDGAPGANGLYTRHLLRHLAAPGLEIEQMFKRVRGDVLAESRSLGGSPQVPWESTSLVGELRLNGGTDGSSGATAGADGRARN